MKVFYTTHKGAMTGFISYEKGMKVDVRHNSSSKRYRIDVSEVKEYKGKTGIISVIATDCDGVKTFKGIKVKNYKNAKEANSAVALIFSEVFAEDEIEIVMDSSKFQWENTTAIVKGQFMDIIVALSLSAVVVLSTAYGIYWADKEENSEE